ncbi:MAG: tRNA pseudouridine(38-40) synthase TruA [Gammaproteobacteria bacterium]|nr:tRNA pseudouridine(38-40) synthase TruA [Gammaproteobacteria bacterium]
MRIALGIEYDGTAYHGWQFQEHCISIQACVDAAISRVANHPVRSTCAGRTDAGVHALQQVVHFDTEAKRTEYAWIMGINSALPDDIRIIWAVSVPASFHARNSAIARSYRYCILNRRVKPALDRHRLCWFYKPLDETLMQSGTQYLIGEHDFTSFRSAGCQSNSPFRRIYTIDVSRKDDCIWVSIIGNAFLHHMVRNIIGVLLEVGSGQHEPQWVDQVLKARDRKAAGITASSSGLYFSGVYYPNEFGIKKNREFNALPDSVKRVEIS